MSAVQMPEIWKELSPECLADPCLNVNCDTCLVIPCAVCNHLYSDHYTTNSGKWSGCETLTCLCDGFDVPENPEDAIIRSLQKSSE